MFVSSLLVRNFRMIAEASLALKNGMQLILGLNAQGKTSLIEALLFLSTSTSHRTRKEEELIRWGEEAAFMRAQIETEPETTFLECGVEKKRKIIKVDGSVLPRVKDLYGLFRTVLFVPEDLAIVDGSPQERRRFLDMVIAQADPAYITLLQQYKRVLQHRNHLLKQLQERGTQAIQNQLDIWNQSFIDFAVQIIGKRTEMVDSLLPLLEEAYDALADDGPLRIQYPPGKECDSTAITEKFTEKIERIRHVEIERGATQTGPHRDDLVFNLAEKNLALFGSQGQRRAAVLALRLAQSKWFEMSGMGLPVLLIDDVVYEMDNTRRSRFWQYLDYSGQMIVTATDREHLGPGIEPNQVFKVDHGEICIY